jgi:hypothetical protein
MMKRIDLISKVGGPAFIGLMMQFMNLETGIVIICLWNIISYFPERFTLHLIYHTNEKVLLKSNSQTDELQSMLFQTTY